MALIGDGLRRAAAWVLRSQGRGLVLLGSFFACFAGRGHGADHDGRRQGQPQPQRCHVAGLHVQLRERFTAQRGLHGTFGGCGTCAQALQRRALRQLLGTQRGVAWAQAGKGVQRGLGGAQVLAQPVVAGLQVGGQGGQPQVELAVALGLGKHSNVGGQRQHVAVPLAQHGVGAAASHALQQRALAADAGGACGGNACALCAAARAEHQANAALHAL